MNKGAESTDIKDIEILFKENYKKLCNVADRIINNWDDAEDVVQDLFIKIWKKGDQLKVESTSRGYLYKATINAALNYLENNKRFKANEQISEHNVLFYFEDESKKIEEKELQQKIDDALDRLPPKCKTIFILSRFEGLKYHEIAEQLNISIKTVENQMGIALHKLRGDLAPYLSTEFIIWAFMFLMIDHLL